MRACACVRARVCVCEVHGGGKSDNATTVEGWMEGWRDGGRDGGGMEVMHAGKYEMT